MLPEPFTQLAPVSILILFYLYNPPGTAIIAVNVHGHCKRCLQWLVTLLFRRTLTGATLAESSRSMTRH